MFTHLKISAVTLGGIMILWSFLAFGTDDSLFVQALAEEGALPYWGTFMFLNGLLLLLGSFFPLRRLRHIGLTLCCFQMFALGGFFFRMGIFTPVSVTMPYLGLMSLITLMAEAKGKKRDGIY